MRWTPCGPAPRRAEPRPDLPSRPYLTPGYGRARAVSRRRARAGRPGGERPMSPPGRAAEPIVPSWRRDPGGGSWKYERPSNKKCVRRGTGDSPGGPGFLIRCPAVGRQNAGETPGKPGERRGIPMRAHSGGGASAICPVTSSPVPGVPADGRLSRHRRTPRSPRPRAVDAAGVQVGALRLREGAAPFEAGERSGAGSRGRGTKSAGALSRSRGNCRIISSLPAGAAVTTNGPAGAAAFFPDLLRGGCRSPSHGVREFLDVRLAVTLTGCR